MKRHETKAQAIVDQRLFDLGFTVETWAVARGYWTHKHQDVCCWQVFGNFKSRPLAKTWLGSWWPLTACARSAGIKISDGEGSSGWREVTPRRRIAARGPR